MNTKEISTAASLVYLFVFSSGRPKGHEGIAESVRVAQRAGAESQPRRSRAGKETIVEHPRRRREPSPEGLRRWKRESKLETRHAGGPSRLSYLQRIVYDAPGLPPPTEHESTGPLSARSSGAG